MNENTTPRARLDHLQVQVAAAVLVPEGGDGMPPELIELREARRRAAEARAAAERTFRDAQAAEAQLVAQEEQALAAAFAAKRERFAENARAALALQREAVEILAALQLQMERIASMKPQMEAGVAAIRASLAEHEDQLRAVEASERKLRADIAIAEREAQRCTRAREQADAAVHATAQHIPDDNGIAPAPAASKPEPPTTLSDAAQRAAERRAADAARAASS